LNTCDNCSAPCCKVLLIEELNKPRNKTCEHLCEGRCKIYSERPEPCKSMECMYLTGQWPEKYHPDKCGIVFIGFNIGTVAGFKLNNNKISKNATAIYEMIKKIMPIKIMEYEEITS